MTNKTSNAARVSLSVRLVPPRSGAVHRSDLEDSWRNIPIILAVDNGQNMTRFHPMDIQRRWQHRVVTQRVSGSPDTALEDDFMFRSFDAGSLSSGHDFRLRYTYAQQLHRVASEFHAQAVDALNRKQTIGGHGKQARRFAIRPTQP